MDNVNSCFEIVVNNLNEVANNATTQCSWSNSIKPLRCCVTILLGIAVFLSAALWLHSFATPPYQVPDYGYSIVATLKLPKSESVVKAHVLQLETDIYLAFGVVGAEVTMLVLSVENMGVNMTNMVFAIDVAPNVPKHPLPSTVLERIQAKLSSLVVRESLLQLGNKALFGLPSNVEVLRFPGGITIHPSQIPYPLYESQLRFKFTLNYSILHIRQRFELLNNQLSLGLRLTANETLYIGLTNSRGSTLDPPTIVETWIVWMFRVPLKTRVNQLSQTIQHSRVKNLGIDYGVFGKADQLNISAVINM